MKVNQLSVLVILLVLFGCAGKNVPAGSLDATFVNSAYKTLYAEGAAVQAAMSEMGQLYQQGKFSETNKQKAIAADTAFKTQYDAAVNALVAYYQAPNPQTFQAAQGAIVSLQVQAAAVTALNVAEVLSQPAPAK